MRGVSDRGCTWRRRQCATGDWGATLVEYAVVLALVVVTAIPAIDYLTERSREEVANQADCVSMRPPPASCQLPAVPPPPQPEDGGGAPDPGDDGVDPGGCDDVDDVDCEAEAPESSVSWAAPTATAVAGGFWEIVSSVAVVDQEGLPVEGALVRFRIEVLAPAWPGAQFPDCVTGPDGTCSVSYTTPIDDAEVVRVRIRDVTAEPPVAEQTFSPPAWDITLPESGP